MTELNNINSRQVVLNVSNSKYVFFMELLKNFDFVQVEENRSDSREEIIDNLTQSFKELKLFKEGKLTARPVDEFLDEL